jgi:hypothetical protein
VQTQQKLEFKLLYHDTCKTDLLSASIRTTFLSAVELADMVLRGRLGNRSTLRDFFP